MVVTSDSETEVRRKREGNEEIRPQSGRDVNPLRGTCGDEGGEIGRVHKEGYVEIE